MRATRREVLGLAAAGLTAALGSDAARDGLMFRRLGIAFGTTVAITVIVGGRREAEAAFAAAFAEIRDLDRMASLTRPEGELYRLNRDGRLDAPPPALLAMLETAARMREATGGAFDVTVQPLWLAMDGAAKAGRWPEAREIAAASARVDGRALVHDRRGAGFARPGMAATLNSLSRGLAADRVAAALERLGVARAFFDTDVLGARGLKSEERPWLARVRDPRRAEEAVAVAPVTGFLATSGDYAYAWSQDYARHHIVDPRRGASPGELAAVTVQAQSGLLADALSTAALLVGPREAPALLRRFGAQGLFVGKDATVWRTDGFPVCG